MAGGHLSQRTRFIPEWTEDDRGSAVFVLLTASLYTLLHLLSWASIRNRFPIDAVAVPFTAVAMARGCGRIGATVQTINPPDHRASVQTPHPSEELSR